VIPARQRIDQFRSNMFESVAALAQVEPVLA
jgi:hypothetical protein